MIYSGIREDLRRRWSITASSYQSVDKLGWG
jgi:hypothetical protein